MTVWYLVLSLAFVIDNGLFVAAENLFDELYATRGINAFDFTTFTQEDFVTPAPGRRYLAGVTWRM